MQKKCFCDTNVLLELVSCPTEIFSSLDKLYISGYTLNELDKLKISGDENVKYLARQAGKLLEEYEDKIEYVIDENNFDLPESFDKGSVDNRIISIFKQHWEKDNEILGLSNDLLFRQKCKMLGLPCEKFDGSKNDLDIYTGIRELSLTEQEYVNLLENLTSNPYQLSLNEYLIINNITSEEQYLFMWNGKIFEEVKTKPIINKYLGKKDEIKPLDIYQKAFIHMLQNDRVKIKITDSVYGCGKSYLMIHWALQMLDHKDKYNKLYFVKSDSPPKDRKPFPTVPGGVNEKCELLMGVLCDVTSEDNLTDILIRNNKLEILPIQAAKGRSLKRSILYINECQDFTPSEIERLLSRVGEDTVVLLDGSTQQIDNKYCLHKNGLTVASNNFKDKNIAAQVNMINDYRSEISKMVNEMDWYD